MNDLEKFRKDVHDLELLLIGVPTEQRLEILRQEIQKFPDSQREIATSLVTVALASKESLIMNKTTIFNIKNNYGQIGEVLNNCTNIINQQPKGESKELLEKLTTEVDALITALPAGKDALKKDVAENLELLIKAATSDEPKRPWYSVSAKGLLEASKFAKDFAGNIAGTIGQLGKLLWPDFKLEDTEEK